MNMSRWIESRIKDSNGNTIAYRIIINNNQKEVMNAMDLINHSKYVTNASLRDNGEFIAKKGHKIKSEVYKKELQAPKSEYKQKEKGIGMGYIDTSKVRDFSENITIDDVLDDLADKYKITNVADDDSYGFLAEELLDDLTMERANYRSYIKEGMDARFMMELRKSAILPFADKMLKVLDAHKDCETVDDIKATRIRELQFLSRDYTDDNWQYYALIRYFLRSKSNNIEFTFEWCYKDCGKYPNTNVRLCRQEFLSHLGV